MKTVQPNFEKLKTLFYQAFYKSDRTTALIALQSVHGDFRPFHQKEKEFLADFNTWLNRLDIRQSGTLINILNENNVSIPNWLSKKKYVIDYNRNDALDLIKTN